MQVEYRLLSPQGKLLDFGLTLATFDASEQVPKTEPLYSFPAQP